MSASKMNLVFFKDLPPGPALPVPAGCPHLQLPGCRRMLRNTLPVPRESFANHEDRVHLGLLLPTSLGLGKQAQAGTGCQVCVRTDPSP